LEGAPASVGGDFDCYGNQLTSLEGAPIQFTKLVCDFGGFDSWDAVPEDQVFNNCVFLGCFSAGSAVRWFYEAYLEKCDETSLKALIVGGSRT
jgi:hypothetical protein